jgi:hypothetical protein
LPRPHGADEAVLKNAQGNALAVVYLRLNQKSVSGNHNHHIGNDFLKPLPFSADAPGGGERHFALRRIALLKQPVDEARKRDGIASFRISLNIRSNN